MLDKMLQHADKHQLERISKKLEQHLGDKKAFVMFEVDEDVHGPHMNEDTAREAVEHMEHDNGGRGEKYPFELTREHMRKHQEALKGCEWDFYYVMNMMYSDYVELFGEDPDKYSRMAMKFLKDVDGPKDKAKRYYYMNK